MKCKYRHGTISKINSYSIKQHTRAILGMSHNILNLSYGEALALCRYISDRKITNMPMLRIRNRGEGL